MHDYQGEVKSPQSLSTPPRCPLVSALGCIQPGECETVCRRLCRVTPATTLCRSVHLAKPTVCPLCSACTSFSTLVVSVTTFCPHAEVGHAPEGKKKTLSVHYPRTPPCVRHTACLWEETEHFPSVATGAIASGTPCTLKATLSAYKKHLHSEATSVSTWSQHWRWILCTSGTEHSM